MKLTIERHDGLLVIQPRVATLEAHNTEAFKAAIAPLLDEGGRLLVDLSEIAFLDSSGLGALILALRTALARGGDLAVCSAQPRVRVLFQLVRAHQIFEVYNDRDEALREQRNRHHQDRPGTAGS